MEFSETWILRPHLMRYLMTSRIYARYVQVHTIKNCMHHDYDSTGHGINLSWII